jgi:PPOX class probable F420-dependent enzyme
MPAQFSRSQWERFLKGRHVAVLATIGADGQPVLTPIWYLYIDGSVVMRTGTDSIKAANIRRDPRVTVCVQDERAPYASVTVYGKAAIEDEQAGLGAKIARHYLGAVAGAAYMRVAAEQIQQSAEVTLVVTPDRVRTENFAGETPLVGKIWLTVKRLLPSWL